MIVLNLGHYFIKTHLLGLSINNLISRKLFGSIIYSICNFSVLSSLFKHVLLVEVLVKELFWEVRKVYVIVDQPFPLKNPLFAVGNSIKNSNFMFKLLKASWCEVNYEFPVSNFSNQSFIKNTLNFVLFVIFKYLEYCKVNRTSNIEENINSSYNNHAPTERGFNTRLKSIVQQED